MNKLDSKNSPPALGFSLPLIRGEFYNNGASPWSSEVGLGTPPQPLTFNCFQKGVTVLEKDFYFKKEITMEENQQGLLHY